MGVGRDRAGGDRVLGRRRVSHEMIREAGGVGAGGGVARVVHRETKYAVFDGHPQATGCLASGLLVQSHLWATRIALGCSSPPPVARPVRSPIVPCPTRCGICWRPSRWSRAPRRCLEYRIERLLGEGGFGQVYLARRLGRSTKVPAALCIKASEHIDGWLREAYFGQLLDEHPRAIRVFDAFPLLRPGRAGPLLPGPRVRRPGRPARVSPPHGQGVARDHGAARDRRDPGGARQAPPRPDAPPRPHPHERVRLRRPAPEARGLRDRPPAERSAGDHRAHPEPAGRSERHPRGGGAEVAGARRRLSGGAAPGDAGEGRRADAGPHARTSAASRAAIP